MKIVIDSHAWINYFEGGNSGKEVMAYLENPANEIITNILNLAEISSFFYRKGKDSQEAHKIILSNSKIYRFDVDFSREAGKLHAQIRKKIKVLITISALSAILILGLSLFFIYQGRGLIGIGYAYLIGQFLTAIMFLWVASRR